MAKRPKSTFQMNLETSLAAGFTAIFRWLPHRAAQRLGSALAVLIHDTAHIRVNKAVENLEHAYPEQNDRWRRRIVRRVYAHFGAVAAELARLPVLVRGGFDRWVATDAETVEQLHRALDENRGAVVASGHLGNWELVGAWAAYKGFPVTYVVARQSNPMIEEFIDNLRRSAGVEIIKRDDAARGVIDALRRKRFVALLIDQDARRDGVFVPFFNRPASTFRGIGTFAVKWRPAVFVMHSWRQRDGRIHFRFRRVEIPETGNRDADSTELVRVLTARLERYIRRHPEQWLWLHRRWKTSPESVSG